MTPPLLQSKIFDADDKPTQTGCAAAARSFE
jgi:hypothetical protein